jgi:hypothetical protein
LSTRCAGSVAGGILCVPGAGNPEMGRNTRTGAAVFSLRLDEDLRKLADERATALGTPLGVYIRSLIERDVRGKIMRRRRKKYDELRRDLAGIHATIIAAGNRLTSADDIAHREEGIAALKDIVSAVLALGREVGAR